MFTIIMTLIKFKMMKSFLKWMSGTVLTVMLLMALPVQQAQAQGDYVSYQTFYDELSPYGQWVNDPDYGNVWVPDAGPDFRPYYTNGQWAMTDYGNTWVSNYNWGWAPFHYGRWTYNPFYGWVWIPGNTWGPAWVSWRYGGGNAGWAPLGPGISLSVSIGNYYCPNDWWVFVGPRYLYQGGYHNHWRGPRYNNTYINNTTIINNTYNNTYVYGPRANEIERVTNQRVNVHRVTNGPRGRSVVNNNTLNIYRPNIRGNASEARPGSVVQAPRSIGKPQSVRNTRPEFRDMVDRGELKQVGTRGSEPRTNGGREQRFDGRDTRQDQVRPRATDGRQMTTRPQREGVDRIQQQDRPQLQQRNDRPQPQERPQSRQRTERPQQMMERPQPQQPRMERPQQQQRMERPQPQQRMERPQPQQRMERPQPQQRMERPQPQQRMERPQPQQRMEQAPRPQPQQSRNDNGGGRRR
jgi:hypothetical protein